MSTPLDYCNTLYGVTNHNFERMQRVQKSLARVVSAAPYRSSPSTVAALASDPGAHRLQGREYHTQGKAPSLTELLVDPHRVLHSGAAFSLIGYELALGPKHQDAARHLCISCRCPDDLEQYTAHAHIVMNTNSHRKELTHTLAQRDRADLTLFILLEICCTNV